MVNAENYARRSLEELHHDSQLRVAQVHQNIKASANVSDETRHRVLADTLHCISNTVSGTPRAATEQQVAQLENTQRRVTAWVENYYRDKPGLIPAHLLAEYALRLQKIVRRAEGAYDNFFGYAGNGITHDGSGVDADGGFLPPWWPSREIVPVAITTSRPGQRWPIRGKQTFDTIVEMIKKDCWCDLDLAGNGSCIRAMNYYAKNKGYYMDADCIPHLPLIFPFAHGDLLIFTIFCSECWRTFVKREKINTKETGVVEPFNEGAGELPY